MDAEMFSTDGGWSKPSWMSTQTHGLTRPALPASATDAAAYAAHKDFAVMKAAHWFKVLCWVSIVIMVMLVIINILGVFDSLQQIVYRFINKGKTGNFTQKEGLQWLGASTDIVRGDYENNQDSLAEKAAKRDASITDLSAPVKATFATREKMTPEEEALKKMGQ